MAYRIYITDAVVCGSKNSNTSDKSYLLFTKEAGMLWAHAKSVREERSKHRYALQDFSVVRVSLVRGKAGWRVTGSEAIDNLYWSAASRETRTLARNTIRLLRRLLHGESPVPGVFDDTVEILSLVSPKEPVLEAVFALRTLYQLGYIAATDMFGDILSAPTLTTAYAQAGDEFLMKSQKSITSALAASHL